jgi:glycosyltransferase involved in cell wall biosynthesis
LAETTGYGLSAASYIRALMRAGIPVTWHPKVMVRGLYRPAVDVSQAQAAFSTMPDMRDLCAAFHAPVDYDTVIVHLTPEHWPGALEPDKRMVGFSVWETDRLPLHWPRLFDGYDLILTPSTFSRDVFAAGTDAPVAVVPHLPRTDWPAAGPGERSAFRRRFGLGDDDFVFYTVNTWILRKVVWLTLNAFLLAFDRDERVVLVVKTNPHGETERTGWVFSRMLFDRIMSNYTDPARVVFVSDDLRYEDLGMLHLAGDAYVSLTRSEGFGLGAFDAVTAGTPVIMTGWSGHLDFLPGEHACLVDYELRQVTQLLGNHRPQEQYWAHADLDHAIEWMRHLYEHPGEARDRGERLKAYVAEHFSFESITRRLVEALNG